MKVVKNKKKLGPILQQERNKITTSRYRILNMTPNQRKTFRNVTQSYLWVIRESQGRLHNPSRPNSNKNFTNNKNWSSNFNGFVNGTPLILMSNNNRYMGHIWVNGVKTRKRTTGHFQQIQKSINMNNFLTRFIKNNNFKPLNRVRVAPVLLNAAEKHLKALGYNAMSTEWPLGKMMNYLNSHPNWKSRGLVYTKKI